MCNELPEEGKKYRNKENNKVYTLEVSETTFHLCENGNNERDPWTKKSSEEFWLFFEKVNND